MTSPPLKLYGSPTSPYVRKVRVLALELNIPLELERVDAHALPSNYGAINPINRIPALRLEDGSMLFDSRVICEYLDTLRGSTLLPPHGRQHWQVLQTEVLGDGILDAAVPRYSEILRPIAQQSPLRLAKYERSIRQILDTLVGDVASLASVNLGTLSVACALGYLDFRFTADAWRSHREALAQWYGLFSQRPSMMATEPDAPFV